MNYNKHYELLITRSIASNRQKNTGMYYEQHHILPECMGGLNIPTNLVLLTAREHFIAHILLVKIYPDHHGLIYAVNKMCRFNKRQDRSKNRMYGWLKNKFSTEVSRRQSGNKNSQYGTCWIFNTVEELSKKVKLLDVYVYLYNGWKRGRVVNFTKYAEKQLKQNFKYKEQIIKEETKKNYYVGLYNDFLEGDCKSIREFQRSRDLKIQSLIDNWRKYIKDFSPKRSIRYKETLEP